MALQPLSDAVLSSIAHSLGDAGGPLVGSVLSGMLTDLNIPDNSGESTKWKFLYHSFRDVQKGDKSANRIGAFLESAFAPARWSADAHRWLYDSARESVNRALLTAGMEIGSDGKLRFASKADTLDAAHERANKLRAALEKRGVHQRVLAACSKLLLKDSNYFHAVFEATKSVAARLREMSRSTADGNALVDETLEAGNRPFPVIALNRYDSTSLKNEQKGITHLVRGLFHAFRNVTAHAVDDPMSQKAFMWNNNNPVKYLGQV